nr:MAG TPA: hypothetical protein [Caudoviricetes sp.]
MISNFSSSKISIYRQYVTYLFFYFIVFSSAITIYIVFNITRFFFYSFK